MFEIRVEHSFPAGHMLRGYQGKCANPHGHNYRIQVTVAGERLNEIGLLADFGDIKRVLREIADRLDHMFLNDLPEFASRNPSAENIALYFYEEMEKSLGHTLRTQTARIAEVAVQETDTAWAVYRPS
jgi:6-pyruvoyltetrahydropterin/6-carboxytetrahydropterin synthase